ncbi:MAG: hypothetical protein U0V56_11840 [Actinomycetota bacterium]
MTLDVTPGEADSQSVSVSAAGDIALFVTDDGIHGAALWRSDGRPEGTNLIADVDPRVENSWIGNPMFVPESG